MSACRASFANEEYENKVVSVEPQCIRDAPRCQMGVRKLTEEEVEQAKRDLTNMSMISIDYPKVVRQSRDPPLAQQNYFLWTFVPSQGAKPDADGSFGYAIFRGTFPNPREAEERSEMLIRDVDSYHENVIGYVGSKFPVTMDSKYCLTTKEVDIRNKMDESVRNNIRSQRETDKKEMEEIQERRRALLADTSEEKKETVDDLDYYTTLRVKRAEIRMLQENMEKEGKKYAKILKQTTTEINKLDEKYPEYLKEYESKYKAGVDAIGGDTSDKNKMIQYMK